MLVTRIFCNTTNYQLQQLPSSSVAHPGFYYSFYGDHPPVEACWGFSLVVSEHSLVITTS